MTSMNKTICPDGAFVIEDFLTHDECDSLIAKAHEMGFDESKVMTHTGEAMIKKIRNNERVIMDDSELADKLFNRAKDFLPQKFYASIPMMGQFKCDLHGLNERFRVYKYGSGEYFKWHKDGSFVRNEIEESQLTFIMYLNDDFEGGETEFSWGKVVPQKGSVLVFPHLLRHQGAEVTSGIKYAIRSDVMYLFDTGQ